MSQFLRMVCACTVASVVAMGCGSKEPAPADSAATAPPKAAEAVTQAAPPPPPKPVAKAAPEAPKPLRVIKSWSFLQLEKPHWQWQFPKSGVQETAQGAFYHVHESQLGPQLVPPINLEAAEISAVRVYLQIMRKGEGDEKPVAVDMDREPLLLWAGPEDLDVEGWVYSESKRRALQPMAPENPNLFLADMRDHENWKGEIARLAITVPVPEDLEPDEQPYNVFIRRIEFLK